MQYGGWSKMGKRERETKKGDGQKERKREITRIQIKVTWKETDKKLSL